MRKKENVEYKKMNVFQQRKKKDEKNLSKSVDKETGVWYYT